MPFPVFSAFAEGVATQEPIFSDSGKVDDNLCADFSRCCSGVFLPIFVNTGIVDGFQQFLQSGREPADFDGALKIDDAGFSVWCHDDITGSAQVEMDITGFVDTEEEQLEFMEKMGWDSFLTVFPCAQIFTGDFPVTNGYTMVEQFRRVRNSLEPIESRKDCKLPSHDEGCPEFANEPRTR